MVLPLVLVLNGCFGVSDEFRDYQKDLAKYSGIRDAHKDVELSLGRFQLYLAERFTGWVDKDLLAQMTIHDISKFEIGVYGIDDVSEKQLNFARFEEAIKVKGWNKFIKTADNTDVTNIYVHLNEDGDEIKDLMIVTLDSESVILIRLNGNFNRIVQRLIRAREIALK